MQAYFHFNYVINTNNSEKYLFDLKPFFKAFTNWKTSITIAKRLAKGDQKLFLVPVPHAKNFYLFISTKTNEAFQKVTASEESIDTIDLLEDLKKNEQNANVGFAAYILFDEERNLFVYASRQGAPSLPVFKDYVNAILPQIGVGGFEFKMVELEHNMDKKDAAELPYMGSTTIRVDSLNPLYNLIAEHLFPDADDKKDVEEIEITLKPAHRQNIRSSVRSAILKLKEQGLVSIRINGKKDGEMDNKQKQFRVTELGPITAELDSIDNDYIYKEMQRLLDENILVAEKYDSQVAHYKFSDEELKDLTRFYEVDEWSNH
ncbi:hypothetical protein [Acinetobacter sp. G18]|uniref:hypothetical protein n=1 Tax=Acinetobacter sp. G18 TaxID=2952152 RepID=UPI004044420E